jgi:guanosine-3',5'-bis(diphosphate) 3'-pyrophosphohydrolase
MITFEDLKREMAINYGDKDIDTVIKAFHFASEAYCRQLGRTGKNYIYHSLATAYNLAKMKMDIPTIVAGLLHDLPEDTDFTFEDLKKKFGSEICTLVNGVTKLGYLKYRGFERYAENLRKMFLAMSQDLRVIIIKLADRRQNMETLVEVREEKRLRIAQETLEIFAPIANCLGMFRMKTELEDLAFPFVYPEEYHWVIGLMKDRLKSESKYIEKIQKETQKMLAKNDIHDTHITGRVKTLYSTYKKLLRKGKDINKIYDLIALRIIVDDVADCYSILELIHNRWEPLKGRFKDFIAQPKPNGYQSLHTAVFTDFGKVVEFQFRTHKMDDEAEFGIAAYSQYKEIGLFGKQKKNPRWLQHLLEIQKTITDNTEFIKHVKLELFANQIFVFTPMGDVLELPEGSTPLDFAYYIHTDIGNQCVGAKINDHIASLDTALKSGDIVEIMTNKSRKYPNPDWIHLVKTVMAKSKIKSQLKK